MPSHDFLTKTWGLVLNFIAMVDHGEDEDEDEDDDEDEDEDEDDDEDDD